MGKQKRNGEKLGEIEKKKPQPIVETAIIEEIIEENISEVESKPKKTKKKKDGI